MNKEIIIKHFQELTLFELYELLRLRAEVFVVEQNCAYQDLDRIDYNAIHLFTIDENGHCSAYARIFRDQSEPWLFRAGRFITVERGNGHGLKLLYAAIDECKKLGAVEIRLHAQVYAIGFYEKAGFSICSEMFLEDNIPHIEMSKAILY